MSKKSLIESLKNVIKENKEDSYGTAVKRERLLKLAMSQIREQYKIKDVSQLKQKHINYLVERWKSENLSVGTLKNRMSNLRWLANKINNPQIVKRDNADYGIDRRKYVDNDKNIAKQLDNNKLEKITDRNVYYSLLLQKNFGLRREESIKFNPSYADKNDHISLKGSWCKGGRPREIPIRTQEQRELLNEIKAYLKLHHQTALIPQNSNFVQQLQSYEYQTISVGETHNHGLRHQYAQDLYKSLTGFECPKCGGLTSRQLTNEQKEIDHTARMIISRELGHNREEITTNYLGR